MSIKSQVEDALFLEQNGRPLGALTMLLLATAASSRRTYPQGTTSLKEPKKKMRDEEAFTQFLSIRIREILMGNLDERKVGSSGLTIVFRDQKWDIEYILYKFYRCELIHDAVLPSDVEFGPAKFNPSPDSTPIDRNIQVSISNCDGLVLDHGWLNLLHEAVVYAPCNGKEFGIKHYQLVPKDGIDAESFLAGVVSQYQTTIGRVHILKRMVYHLTPTIIINGAYETIAAQFKDLIVTRKVNGGQILGLAHHGFTNRTGELEARGLDALRSIASGFLLIEYS